MDTPSAATQEDVSVLSPRGICVIATLQTPGRKPAVMTIDTFTEPASPIAGLESVNQWPTHDLAAIKYRDSLQKAEEEINAARRSKSGVASCAST